MLANKLNYGDTIGVDIQINSDNQEIEIIEKFLN